MTPPHRGNPKSGDQVLVASSDALVEGEPVAFEVHGRSFMLVRHAGTVYGISNVCTHQRDVFLSDGFFDDGYIECTLHQARFDVRTGAVMCGPATDAVETYSVTEDHGSIFLKF